MRFLWLNAGLLLPLDKGGQRRSSHLLRHFVARDVTHVSFDDQGDPERFAHEVVRLIRDTHARGAPGHAARALVEGRCDWSAVAQDVEVALTRLVGPPHETHTFAGPDRRQVKRESPLAALREA